jgi:hypothetical protein
MPVTNKLIIRKRISILLIIALNITGLFSCQNTAYADSVVLSEEVYYHLDMGVQIAYNEDCDWGIDNIYGSSKPLSVYTTVTFNSDIEVIDTYPLNSSKGSNFDFNGDTSSHNISNQLGDASWAYGYYYQSYVSTTITEGNCSSNGKYISFNYIARLNTTEPLEVVSYGKNGNDQEIYRLFGGKTALEADQPEIAEAIETALEAGANGTAGTNKLYLIFCPNVIEYKKYITVGDLEAKLDLPSSAKQGESYTASDASLVDSRLTVEDALLEKHYGDGDWEEVTTWNGTGNPGKNTGGSVDESCEEIGSVTYRLTAETTNGQTDTDTRTITITDGRDIDGQAILELPEYTYEGHPALARDVSVFNVDGVKYSARRAYEEDVAENEFLPLPSSAGSASRESLTTANVVFPKKGNYNVKLKVDTASGKTLSDIKPIIVRKTPYILDSLGGFQKQNRKQVLDISVATYPGKPVTDYYIKLRDMETSQEITLTQDRPQQNNAMIKTRTVTTDGNTCWTNYELQFLTKNTREQEFRYTIYMKDSKGDTDTVQKVFAVKPDLPPNAEINMQDSFIRNKGTNAAEIMTEDASTTDGDQLERIWSAEGANVRTLAGYQDLSFGTGQKVKFNKTGVGEVDVTLDVKDVWIEPTLEEYVTDADRKTAATTKTTDVINIAPTVRLEPKNTKETDIVIVTDKRNKAEIGASINTLKAALIEKGFDPHISLAAAADADDGPYRRVASWTWDTTVNCGICQQNAGQMDSDYVYRITSPGKYVDGYQERCVADRPHVLEALAAGSTAGSGYTAWSYPVNESRSFGFALDNKERYVYLTCYDTGRTVILNRDNGAYLTTLNVVIPGTPFIGDDTRSIYFIGSSNIQKYDTTAGTLSTVINRGGSLAQMLDGKITFVGKKDTNAKQNKNGAGFYIGKFDMNSETIEEISIPDLPETTGVVSPMDMDNKGKVLLKQGNNIWVADTKKYTVKMTSQAGIGENMNSTVFVKNEKGEGVYTAHAYNTSEYDGDAYFYFTLYDFSGTSLTGVSGFSDDFYGYNWNGLSYAKLHSRENKIYIMQGNNFDGMVGSTDGFMFRIDVPTMGIDRSFSGWGWDVGDESGAYNGSLMRTFYVLDRWIGQSDRINLFRNSITESEAKTLALRTNARSGSGESDNYVIVAGEDAASQILQDQSFQDEIDLRGARSLFFNIKDSIGTIAEIIEALGDSLKNYLLLEGDGLNNTASLDHKIQLQPNMEYEYEYSMTTTGKAIDIFGVNNPNNQGLDNDNRFFETTAAYVNFNYGISEPFFSVSGGTVYSSPYYGYGYGTVASAYGGASCSISFTMEKDGYISFDNSIGSSGYKKGSNSINFYLNGELAGSDGIGGYSAYTSVKKIYLNTGSYVLRIDHTATNGNAYATINNLKAVYYEDTAEGFRPAALSSTNGREQMIKNSFRVSGKEALEVKARGTVAMTTRSGIEYSKYISSSSYYRQELWDPVRRTYYWVTYQGGPFSFNEATGVYFYGGNDYYYPSFNITAPADKFLIYSYDLSYAGGKINDKSQAGVKLMPSSEVRLLRPGQTQTLACEMFYYKKAADKYPKMYVSNIKIAEFDASAFGGTAKLQTMNFNVDNKTVLAQNGSEYIRAELDQTTGIVTLKYMSDIENTAAGLNNGIHLSTSESAEKISALVSSFRFYQKIGGARQLIFSQNFNSQKALDLTGWNTALLGDGRAEIVSAKLPEKEEDAPLVYKKGQLIAYNIFYDDYENDPSKKQYWRYTHTPYNDGPHPQAAFLLDEEGNVASSSGLVLAQSIPRFYIDGKYMVEHWQEDNTNRTGADSGGAAGSEGSPGAVDYSKYDKLSNIETITFYIEGGATAPWVTSIKTIPDTVKEGGSYRLQIGVDDAEKDELRLTTELYRDKKLIYTHRQTAIIADSKGIYPLTTTGYPPAAAVGKYDAVCTVRDLSGAGIGTYQFTVVSEGKVTGAVTHTPQWDENRKKYNLKRFSDEINRISLLCDYIALPTPRPRGTNVFWSGEKFILNAETEGSPSRVNVQIMDFDPQSGVCSTGYSTTLSKTGSGSGGTERWQGSLWDRTMINKWGRKEPEELLFIFTAAYEGGMTKTHQVRVIIDSYHDYWQLHRLW